MPVPAKLTHSRPQLDEIVPSDEGSSRNAAASVKSRSVEAEQQADENSMTGSIGQIHARDESWEQPTCMSWSSLPLLGRVLDLRTFLI